MKLCKKEKKVECDHNEYCPIYLSYLGEYGESSKEVKYCKNSNVKYCTKYNLINDKNWTKISTEEKLEIIKDMDLLKYINKRT